MNIVSSVDYIYSWGYVVYWLLILRVFARSVMAAALLSVLAFACVGIASADETSTAAGASSGKWQGHAEYIVRSDSFSGSSGFEAFVPISQSDDSLVFLDWRLNGANEDDYFGNWGIGARRILGPDLLLGGYAFLDVTRTQTNQIHRAITIGAEALTINNDFRVNFHIPINGKKIISDTFTAGSGTTVLGIVNNQLTTTVAGGEKISEVPLFGADAEVGMKIDFGLLEKHDFRVFAGGYHYWADAVEDITGARGRFEYQIGDAFGIEGAKFIIGAEVTYDDVRDVQYVAEARLQIPFDVFSGGGNARFPVGDLSTIERRADNRIYRTTRIQTREERITAPDVSTLAIDDRTGKPFGFIFFADGSNSLGLGNEVDPTTLKDAVARSGANGIIVAEGKNGVITTAGVTLQTKQYLLGGGSQVPVRLNSGVVNHTLGVTPGIIKGTDATATIIGLANDVRIENITLQGGNVGFGGNNITGANFNNITVKNTAGDGIHIVGATDTMISNAAFSNIGGTAIFLNNESATLNDITIDGALNGLSIGNNTGTTTLKNISISNVTNNGVTFTNPGGTITTTALSVDKATGNGVAISGGNGVVSFKGTTTLKDTGDGILIKDVGGAVSFETVKIDNPGNNAGDAAIDIEGTNGGAISFGDTTITNLAGNRTGLDFNGSDPQGGFTMSRLSLTGRGGAGSIGIDLDGTKNNRSIIIGTQTNSSSDAPSSISGVAIGVRINNAHATFIYGDSEGTTDTASKVDASTPITIAGLGAGNGTYNLRDAQLTGNTTNLSTATTFFVDAGGVGAGTQADPGTLAQAEASGADVIILVDGQAGAGTSDTIDASSAIQGNAGGNDTFDLADSQRLMTFRNSDTITIGGSQVNLFLTGFDGTVTDLNAGFGAPTLTSSGGSDVIQLANNNIIDGVVITAGTSGIGIIGTDIQNATIQNSLIIGNTRAITIIDNTGAAGASTITLENNVLSNTSANYGVAIVAYNAASDLRLRINNNTFSANGNLALYVDGDVAGARRITIEQFASNTVNTSAGASAGISLEGIVFDNDLTTAGIQVVSGGNTLLGTTAARLRGGGLRLVNVEGTLSFDDLDIANDIDTGLLVQNSKANSFTLNVDAGGAANATVDTTNGTALDLDPLTINMVFASVNSSGGTNGIKLDTVDGAIVINGGAISGTSGAAFDVNAGTVSATYAGNITQTNNAAAVNVDGGHNTGTITFQTGTISATNGNGLQFNNADGTYNFNGTTTLNGGNAGIDIIGGSNGTFTFASATSITNPTGTAFNVNTSTGGNVTYNGTINQTNTANAIAVASKTGGTVTIGGLVTASTTTTNAVNLTNNTGGTVTFTGGLALTTTSAVGFNVSGGGTVNTTGTNNTVTSTTGTAVQIANTAIGGSGVTFRSVNSNGGANGLVLNNTGTGAFTITGTGTTAGSGGTIQNATDSGISITNAGNITLNNFNLTNGNTVDAAGTCTTTDFSGCNAALDLKSVQNVSINNMNLNGSAEHGIFAQSVATLNITDSQITNAGGVSDEHGILFVNTVNATNANLTVRNSTLTDNRGKGIAVYGANGGNFGLTLTGSTLSGAQDAAIDMTLTGTSSGTFNITGNNALAATHPSGTVHAAIRLDATGTGSFTGTIANNTNIGSATEEVHGILIEANTGYRGIVAINNNSIQSNAGASPFTYGIEIASYAASNVDVTLQNNTIAITGGTFPVAIAMRGGKSLPGSTARLCANLSNNTGTSVGASTYFSAQGTGATFALQGLGGTVTAAATVEAFLQGTDTGTPNANVSQIVGNIVNYTDGTCVTP